MSDNLLLFNEWHEMCSNACPFFAPNCNSIVGCLPYSISLQFTHENRICWEIFYTSDPQTY